jgi:peptidoglycan/xylan/chitin deacetylase (PgdA/CDA1 family)
MLKKVKQFALKGLKTSGMFTVIQNSKWRQERLLILAYHGISLEDEDQWNPELYMHRDTFKTRMQILKNRRCTVLPLNEALQRLYANDLPRNCVAITFDDGYFDFYRQALPILEEYGFPATLYLATLYTNYKFPVFDAVCPYLLWKGRNSKLDLKRIINSGVEIDLSTADSRATAEKAIIEFARNEKMSIEEKDSLAAKLADQLGLDYSLIRSKRILNLLQPDEVRLLSDRGVDVQLHTHRHRVPQDQKSFFQEIEENRNCIRQMTSLSARHFCYPSGIFDEAFIPWLNDLEIVSATTCDPGLASRDTHQLFLPRFVDTSMQSMIEFEGWVTGISSALPHRQSTYEAPRVVWEFASEN